MTTRTTLVALCAMAGWAWASPSLPAAAQETGLKAGFSVSRLETSEPTYWDDRITQAGYGGHIRFRFGPVALQPELLLTAKGASSEQAAEEGLLRIEYIELPVLLVLPLRVGAFEPFAYGGPSLMLESRCRWSERQQGLRTTVTCDPPRGPVFPRRSFDYGAVAGGGISYPVWSGRVMAEGRYTWGLRSIHDGADIDIRNRTFSMYFGYSVGWGSDDGR
jgi:hypothetical protein